MANRGARHLCQWREYRLCASSYNMDARPLHGRFCLLTRRPIFRTREDTRQAITGGFFQAVSIITLYMALEFLPGPLVIIILFTHTLMLLFYLAWRREIKLDRFTVLTTLTALGGLSLVLNIWQKQPIANIWGIMLALVAALATVSRLYVFGHQTQDTTSNCGRGRDIFSDRSFYDGRVIL